MVWLGLIVTTHIPNISHRAKIEIMQGIPKHEKGEDFKYFRYFNVDNY